MRKEVALCAILVVALTIPTFVQQSTGAATPTPPPATTVFPVLASPPLLMGADGTYLGVLSTNQVDPESVSNPFGADGSPYSPTSINNAFSVYGSKYSPSSANRTDVA